MGGHFPIGIPGDLSVGWEWMDFTNPPLDSRLFSSRLSHNGFVERVGEAIENSLPHIYSNLNMEGRPEDQISADTKYWRHRRKEIVATNYQGNNRISVLQARQISISNHY